MPDSIQVQFYPDRRHVHRYHPYPTGNLRFISLRLTQSWGAEPGSAILTYVKSDGTLPQQPSLGLRARIRAANNIYWMLLNADREEGNASSGFVREAELVDYREYLKWDYVFCAFNMREDGLDERGNYRRWYWHIYPQDFNTGKRSYTTSPLTAYTIMETLFNFTRRNYGGRDVTNVPGAGIEAIYTIETYWTRQYHDDLRRYPATNLNWLRGETLGSALAQISSQLGLVFTLNHQHSALTLQWARKGEGRLPLYENTNLFPPTSFNRRTGFAISGAPTRVRVVGGRNQYQIHGLIASPDWNPAYQQFVLNQAAFIRDIYENATFVLLDTKRKKLNEFPLSQAGLWNFDTGQQYTASERDQIDTENVRGWMLAFARARSITLFEYSNLKAKQGTSNRDQARIAYGYRDPRKYKGQSRNNMPVWLYIQNIVFKAFSIKGRYRAHPTGPLLNANSFLNAGNKVTSVSDANVQTSLLMNVNHNPVTGYMSANRDAPPTGDGYAIVRGYAISAETFSKYNPDRFDYAAWVRAQLLWQNVPFELDEENGWHEPVLLFSSPIIDSKDFFIKVDEKYVINANPVINIPEVRASLTFEAEIFSHIRGRGERDKVLNVPNLRGLFLTQANVASGSAEIPLEDGRKPSQVGAQIAEAELKNPFIYFGGGYSIPVDDNNQIPLSLSPMLDRISLDVSARGSIVQVDFTKERERNTFVPERELDHALVRHSLLPGQESLREEVDQFLSAAALVSRNKNLRDALIDVETSGAKPVQLAPRASNGLARIPAGSPVWKKATINEPARPQKNTQGMIHGVTEGEIDEAEIFMGVVFREGENPLNQNVATISSGDTVALVKGQVSANESIGKSSDGNYLVANGKPSVGVALQDKESDEDTKLIAVRIGTGNEGDNEGSGGGVWK